MRGSTAAGTQAGNPGSGKWLLLYAFEDPPEDCQRQQQAQRHHDGGIPDVKCLQTERESVIVGWGMVRKDCLFANSLSLQNNAVVPENKSARTTAPLRNASPTLVLRMFRTAGKHLAEIEGDSDEGGSEELPGVEIAELERVVEHLVADTGQEGLHQKQTRT